MARPFTEPLEARTLLCGDIPAPADRSEGLPRDLIDWSATAKRVLEIVARFPDQAAEDAPSPAVAAETMSRVDQIMRANSYGKVSITAEVTGVVVLPRPMAGPGAYGEKEWQQVLDDARAAAAAAANALPGPRADWDYRNYDLYTVRYNGGPGSFPGAAAVRSRRSWLKDDSPWIVAHEFGHNLGLWHANALRPQDPSTTTGHGPNDEYGNPFDVMGRSRQGPLAFNAWEKNRLGWLPDAYVTTASASDAADTYTIYPFDTTERLRPGRRYAIRVAKDPESLAPGDRREYWVGFRQDEGWTRAPKASDPNPAFNPGLTDGVEVNWCAWGPAGSTAEETTTAGSNGGSHLLDMTPQTPGATPESAGRADAALTIGHTFTDDVAGVRITPLRKRSDGGIDVRVSFAADSQANAPPAAALLAGAADVAPNRPVIFKARASDADGDPLAYAWDFGDGSFARPGDSDGDGLPDAFDASVIHRWSAPGDYRVRVTVSDMKGGTASASAMVRVAGEGEVLPTRRLSGAVRDVVGAPLADVRVAVGGLWALTDSDGTYTLPVPRSGRVPPVMASKAGWSFERAPSGLSSTANFDGIEVGYHVSGKVTDESGSPLSGVLASTGARSSYTDADGNFLIPVSNGVYSIGFSKEGYVFRPGPTFAVEYADKSLNGVFFGNPVYVVAEEGALNGHVLGLKASMGMRVTVTARSAAGVRSVAANMTFDYDSPYYVVRVPTGTWNVTATGTDAAGRKHSFSPAGRWSNPLVVTGSMQAIDFALDPVRTNSLEGQVIYSDGVGVPGATVRVGDKIAVTADDGGYVIRGLSPGAYRVFASKPGLRFYPGHARVTGNFATASLVPAMTGSPGNAAPTITAAAATPQPVVYRATWLTASAEDDAPSDRLRYTWSVVGRPAGAGVRFRANGRDLNGTNAAGHILALFDKPGLYLLRVTATDESGAESRSALVRVRVGDAPPAQSPGLVRS